MYYSIEATMFRLTVYGVQSPIVEVNIGNNLVQWSANQSEEERKTPTCTIPSKRDGVYFLLDIMVTK